MWFAKLRRWQWMVAGLLLGAALGIVYDVMDPKDLLSTAPVIGEQALFEDMLLRSDHETPRFRNIVVHPYPDSKATDKSYPTFVVSGRYFDGSSDEGGRALCFVATSPYKAGSALARVAASTKLDLVRQFAAMPDADVRDYLSMLQKGVRLEYRYAWWDSPGRMLLLWCGSGFIVVGVVFPTLLCYAAFGRLWGPPIEPAGRQAAASAVPSQLPPETNLDSLRQAEMKVERALAGEMKASGDEPRPQEPAAVADLVRRLDNFVASPAEPQIAVARDASGDAEFDMKPEDYYPTEHRRPQGVSGTSHAGPPG